MADGATKEASSDHFEISEPREEIRNILDKISSERTISEIKEFIDFKYEREIRELEEKRVREEKEAKLRAKLKAQKPVDNTNIIMHILNGMLVASGKGEIKDMTEFAMFREDLLSDEVNNYLDTKGYQYAFDNGMKKGECCWHTRKRTATYSLTFLKYLIKWENASNHRIISNIFQIKGVRRTVYNIVHSRES